MVVGGFVPPVKKGKQEGSTVEILNDRELLESNGLELPLSLSGHR